VALRTSAGREVGWFDDDFFLYYEDTDLSWRLRAAGWAIRYEPSAVVRHVHSASSVEWSPTFVFHTDRNRLLMLVKNATPRLALREVGRYPLTTARSRCGPCAPRRGRACGPAVRPTLLRLRVLASLPAPAAGGAAQRAGAGRAVPRRELQRWLVGGPVRVGLDATPPAGRAHRASGATPPTCSRRSHPVRTSWWRPAFTLRGRGALVVPAPVAVRARPVPARLLQEAWARGAFPPVELLTGRLDVFHATNFVLPPLRRAGGVVTVHDLAFLRLTATVSAASARYRDLVPRSLRRARVVVTPSLAVADQVREAYAAELGATPVHVVPHGVDPRWSTASPPDAALRARLGLPSAYVLFVGTLEPRKDLRTLLAAHQLVPDAPPLVLVGPPGWGEQVDVSAAITPGFVGDDDLRRVVAGADALVLPSRDEGFGLTVLEALAAGTPVVASDLPVLREVGGTAVTYAPAGDAEAFACALSAVLASPGDPALRRAQAAGFTWQRSAALHRAAYALATSRP
jgi:glycosyltransferase involved in cell wall biosynthesis